MVDATMIIMGSMIGSGIFLAPALIGGIVADARVGPGAFVLVWIIGGLLTVCAALSFGELAASMPNTGGQYVYLKRAFSPFWGYLYGWTLFTVIQTGFIAAVAVAFANYLGVVVPGIGQSIVLLEVGPAKISTVQVTAMLLIAALSWINSRGLRSGSVVQNLLGVAKIAALVVVIAVGFSYSKGSWAHFTPLLPPTANVAILTAIAIAMSKVLFAYDSWNVVTFVSDQARDPARLLPRALFLGTVGVTLIYTITTAAYLYIMPVQAAAAVPDQRIAAEAARIVIGGAGVFLVTAAILISTAGCVNGLILSGPWLYHAMARDGLFFRGAARLNPKQAPVRSLVYQSLWACALILSGSLGARGAQLYSDLLTFTSFASLLFNTLTIAGLFILRIKEPELDRPYRVTAYPLVPLAYVLIATFFLVFIAVGDPRNAGLGTAVILCGIVPYIYWRKAPTLTGKTGGRTESTFQPKTASTAAPQMRP
jgi:APA family basic amino acid/polyamine antiporter